MVKATKGHRKIILEADWLKTTGIISGVPVLSCPSSPHPPVHTNDGIITQNIFNAAVPTSVELKTNTKKLYFCG